MKRLSASRGLWAMVVSTLVAASCLGAGGPRVRNAGVAGSFYPGDREQLSAMVDGFVADAAVKPGAAPVVALVAPHAGYQFSGAVAGHAYALLKGKTYQRVIVIAPSHYVGFGYSSVFNGDAYTTPLGQIAIDRQFATRLAGADPSIRFADAGHELGQQPEHSLEVQLPFLQRVLGNFRLVPIVMGNQSYQASRALGIALAKLLQNDRETLIVASSDLSHYHPYDEATTLDRHLLAAITQDDFLTVSRNTQIRAWEACGAGPVVAAMIAAERLGASAPRLLKYANSGDVTGDKSRVVGYSAVAFVRDTQTPPAEKITLSGAERAELLKIARTAVEMKVREHKDYEPPRPQSANLLQDRGAFVTLTRRGSLRGCIGYVAPFQPLYLAIRDVAISAAVHDNRFPPVKADELSQLEYEISVLSPFHHQLDPRRVRVGEHGLLIKRGNAEGVLLPQVPVEQHWDRDTFLDQASLKAGLSPRAWQDAETDVFSFTALVFSGNRLELLHEPSAGEQLPPPSRPPGADSPRP